MNKMKRSELRKIIREELGKAPLNESKKWYDFDDSNVKLKSNILQKWDAERTIFNDLIQFAGAYYNTTGDIDDFTAQLQAVIKHVERNSPD